MRLHPTPDAYIRTCGGWTRWHVDTSKGLVIVTRLRETEADAGNCRVAIRVIKYYAFSPYAKAEDAHVINVPGPEFGDDDMRAFIMTAAQNYKHR